MGMEENHQRHDQESRDLAIERMCNIVLENFPPLYSHLSPEPAVFLDDVYWKTCIEIPTSSTPAIHPLLMLISTSVFCFTYLCPELSTLSPHSSGRIPKKDARTRNAAASNIPYETKGQGTPGCKGWTGGSIQSQSKWMDISITLLAAADVAGAAEPGAGAGAL